MGSLPGEIGQVTGLAGEASCSDSVAAGLPPAASPDVARAGGQEGRPAECGEPGSDQELSPAGAAECAAAGSARRHRIPLGLAMRPGSLEASAAQVVRCESRDSGID